jgi:hypothetical protein
VSPKRRFPSILACGCAAVALSGFAVYATEALPAAAEIDGVLQKLSEITGMPVKHQLRFQSISRAEVSSYLEGRAKKTIKTREILAEESALRLLGLVPEGFDLRKMTVDLLTEQAAAFYDYQKKKLFLADWTPGGMRDETVVHELAHALADQNVNLGKYEKKVEDDGEQSAAREAVVEGQAQYLTLAYAAAEKGEQPLDIVPDSSDFDSTADPTGEYPVFDKAPLYFRVTLIFPYTWGMTFQAAVVRRYGREGFRHVFTDAPVSTQQILHPDMYFSHVKPVDVDLPDPPKHMKVVFGSTLGELDHRVLLEQYTSRKEADKMSAEWRGGGFAIFAAKHNDRKLLEYASEWSSDRAAGRFLSMYRRVIMGKMKGAVIDQASDDAFSGHGCFGHDPVSYFHVKREGKRVTSVENMPEPE